MSAARFYLAPEAWRDEQPSLSPEEAKHCSEVLRGQVGQQIVVFDGQGHWAEAEVTEISRRSVTVSLGARQTSCELPSKLILAQAIPKGKTMDLVIQKATELGVSHIIPLVTENTVVRFRSNAEAEKKTTKWQRVALEACKQCGQNWTPKVASPRSFSQLLADQHFVAAEFKLVASLYPGAVHLKKLLPPEVPKSAVVLVGPEGDFSQHELERCVAAGCQAMTLGPIILRAETAAIYCASVLAHEFFVEH